MKPDELTINIKCCTMVMFVNLPSLQNHHRCTILSFFDGFEQKNLSLIELMQEKNRKRHLARLFLLYNMYQKTE